MNHVQLTLDEKGSGSFFIMKKDEKIAEMVFDIGGDTLTVYHTNVIPEEEGKGLSNELLNAMIAYVREHHLTVIPLCPFVHTQFRRHPELYESIWNKVMPSTLSKKQV
jgi:uncharacterized protein